MSIFEITIQRKDKDTDTWPVVVRHQPGAHELALWSRGQLEFDLGDLDPLLPSEKAYGRLLGKALFRDDIRDAFVRAVAGAKGADSTLRVLLIVEADDLRRHHWEQLCAPLDRGWDYMLLNQGTPFSLYLPSQIQLRFPPIGRRDLRALILVAGPEELDGDYGLTSFDADATVRGIQHALGVIPCDVLAPVEGAIGPPTLNILCEQLTAGNYTLLHIVCHGKYLADSEETTLYFPGDEIGEPVLSTDLIERLGRLDRLPHFTFLSTCESAAPRAEAGLGGLGQRLVRELGMPAVLAMTDRISIATAEALASMFYARLHEHGEIDRALCEALAGLQGRYDVTVPALFSRLGDRPLWGDALDRPLTDTEIGYGLEQMQGLLEQRAPVLLLEYQTHTAKIRATLGADSAALSAETRRERDAALTAVNQLCGEALDLSFNAIALGRKPPDYDSRCPFPGLSAFGARFLATGEVEQDDRAFFFGREALIERLKEKLAEHNFLPILGPSGSGKSSLVIAGLIPELQKEEKYLQLAYLTPGSHPLAQLEASRSEVGGEPAVLVVDQFEELFTLRAEERERQVFLGRLLALAGEMRVVIAMRADFWGECAPYPALKAEMQARQELIAAMDASELRVAIEQQAQKVGLRFEADLSNTMVDAVLGEPGPMPLLQHALLELWNRRHGRWLMAEEYRDGIGGVQQAIAHTADALYRDLSPDERERMRDIFLRLTRLGDEVLQGEERRDTRQRVRFEELVPAGSDPAPIRKLVQQLADARLVVTGLWMTPEEGQALDDGGIKVEVAHEALIHHWPRLRTWLNVNYGFLLWRKRLNEARSAWIRTDHATASLLRGPLLSEALNWSAKADENQNLTEEELAFISLSERESQLEETRWQELYQRAVARQLAAQSEIVKNQRSSLLERSLLLAVEAQKRSPSIEGDQALRRNLALLPRRKCVLDVGASLRGFAFGPKGQLIAIASHDDFLRLWSWPDAIELWRHKPESVKVMGFAFSPDGRHIAVSNHERPIQILDITTGEPIAAAIAQAHSVTRVVWSPNGQLLAVSGWTNASVWKVSNQQSQISITQSDNIVSLEFSPDSMFVATGTMAGTINVWEVTRGQNVWTVRNEVAVEQLAVSPDGKLLAAPSSNGLVMYDMTSGQQIANISTGQRPTAIAFSPIGRYLAIASGDRAEIREVESARLIRSMLLDEHFAEALAFSPRGDYLATAGSSIAAVWHVETGTEVSRIVHAPTVLDAIDFSPDGGYIAALQDEHTVGIWEAFSSADVACVRHVGDVDTVSFSKDGRFWAIGSQATPRADRHASPQNQCIASVQTLETRAVVTQRYHCDFAKNIVFSSDSRLFATIGQEDAYLWETHSGALLRTIEGVVTAIAFAPLVPLCAVARQDGTVKIWNTQSGDIVSTFAYITHVMKMEFTNNAKHLMTVTTDKRVHMYDPESQTETKILSIEGELISMAPRDDGGIIAGATSLRSGKSQYAVIWEIGSGERTWHIPHESTIEEIALSRCGSFLATGCADHAKKTYGVHIWHLDSRRHMAYLSHDGGLLTMTFDTEANVLATGSRDGTARVWNVTTGQELARVKHDSYVSDIAFSPDGKYVASAGWDGYARLWMWQAADMLAEAATRVTRNLTEEEWRRDIPDEPYRKTFPGLS